MGLTVLVISAEKEKNLKFKIISPSDQQILVHSAAWLPKMEAL